MNHLRCRTFIFAQAMFLLLSPWASADKPVVVIDAGHGGSQVLDHSSPNNASFRSAKLNQTIKEKDLTLEIANEVIRIINATDQVKALATRTKDENVGMKQRASVALQAKAAALISIHFNSTPKAKGPLSVIQATEYQGKPANTKEQYERDKIMGDKLAKAIATVSSKYLEGTKAMSTIPFRAKPEGSHLFRYLREDPMGKTMDACFLEVDFMDNPKVAAWLIESPDAAKARQEISQAIATAVIEHVSKK